MQAIASCNPESSVNRVEVIVSNLHVVNARPGNVSTWRQNHDIRICAITTLEIVVLNQEPLAIFDFKHVFAVAGSPVVVGLRRSTRLNSSHGSISYAVFCLNKTT